MNANASRKKIKYIYCAYREWSLKLFSRLDKKLFYLVDTKDKLTLSLCQKIKPEYIFFPDWSWKVPKEIFSKYKCIIFHESNVPKFRGGSPIQNQIFRGIKKTKHSALMMIDKIDAGDILLQRNLDLTHQLDEIFNQISKNVYIMIQKIIKGDFKLKKQKGKATFYKRRQPEESELKMSLSIRKIYDFIRMLADPYPNAFVRIDDKKIIFKKAKFEDDKIKFQGEIHG